MKAQQVAKYCAGGIAQPVTIDSENRLLAWFDLNWTSLFAIVVSGLVFYMLHLGRANHVEVALSLPGGYVGLIYYFPDSFNLARYTRSLDT